MKYPKLWNGSSPVGEALARHLNKLNPPWLSAIAGDVIANKQGRRSEVFQGVPDALFALGYEDETDKTNFSVRAATGVPGLFVRRGRWGKGQFLSANFRYTGGGKGVVPERLEFNTQDNYGVDRISVSRFGRTFKPVLTFAWANDRYSNFAWEHIPLGRSSAAADFDWTYGFQFTTGVEVGPDGLVQFSATWAYTLDGGNTWAATQFGYPPGYLVGTGRSCPIDDATLFVVVPTYLTRSSTVGSLGSEYVTNDNPHLSFVLKLSDGGQSAAVVDPGDLLNFKFPAGVEGSVLNGWEFERWNYDIAAGVRDIRLVRLVTGQVLGIALSRMYDRAFIGETEVVDLVATNSVVIFLGTESGGFTRIGTVFQPGGFFGSSAEPKLVGDRVVTLLQPNATSPIGMAQLLVFDPDGTTWTMKPMPYAPHRVSTALLVLDETTFAVPMYGPKEGSDGDAYRLYVTEDYGDSWRAVSTISSKAPEPPEFVPETNPPVPYVAMSNYATVAQFRVGAANASVTPGAPWYSDGRLPKPWETGE